MLYLEAKVKIDEYRKLSSAGHPLRSCRWGVGRAKNYWWEGIGALLQHGVQNEADYLPFLSTWTFEGIPCMIVVWYFLAQRCPGSGWRAKGAVYGSNQ